MFCKGKTIEETMYRYALTRGNSHVFVSLGLQKTFACGDFSRLYRYLALYVRSYYGCALHAGLLQGDGYAAGTGIDHGTYGDIVPVCFALMRPDWAKCFFPKELGPVKKSHPLDNHAGSLIIGLLHDEAVWKEQAYTKGRKFLEGKRGVAERALVSYLCNLYDGNTDGMSDDLATLMRSYRKATWLMMGSCEEAVVSLFGYYLMGKLYLDESEFAKVRRPSGPGWWDEYVDLCMQDPIPAAWSEPAFTFPEPLGFLNTAVRWIEQGPPPGTVRIG